MPNISAKHEGGAPSVEAACEHPSDILDYIVPKEHLNKHAAVNHTAADARAGQNAASAP